MRSEAGNASFRAELERVQYGTYKDQPACLLTFTFLFQFNGQSRLRFQSAKITIRFRRGRSATASRQVVDDDDDDGPHILQLAPFRVYGELKNRRVQTTLKVEAPVRFQTPVNVGMDFADKAFDWSKVLDNPTEYQVGLL
jgi:hypothetical protein